MKRSKTPYIRCVNCGAHLDPGERCDCERREAQETEKAWKEWYSC